MGYCMNLRDANFQLKEGTADKARKAINAMADSVQENGGGGSFAPGKEPVRHYSWVNTLDLVAAKTFKEAMEAWRWNVTIDDEGQIEEIYFEGEKLGDDAQLFDAIAPFVKAGSYIEMHGEDGSIWRWAFDGEKMVEQDAQITWN